MRATNETTHMADEAKPKGEGQLGQAMQVYTISTSTSTIWLRKATARSLPAFWCLCGAYNNATGR